MQGSANKDERDGSLEQVKIDKQANSSGAQKSQGDGSMKVAQQHSQDDSKLSNNSPDKSKTSNLGKRDCQGNLVQGSAQKDDTENFKKDDEDIDGDSDKSDDKSNDENSDGDDAFRKAPALRGIGVSRNRRNKATAQIVTQGDTTKDQGRKEMPTAQKKTKKKAAIKAVIPG